MLEASVLHHYNMWLKIAKMEDITALALCNLNFFHVVGYFRNRVFSQMFPQKQDTINACHGWSNNAKNVSHT